MNRYQPSTPRAAFAVAAIALAVLTFGLAVVAPAKLNFDAQDARSVTTARAPAPQPTQVVISPSRIDVVAPRPPIVDTAEVGASQPSARQPG